MGKLKKLKSEQRKEIIRQILDRLNEAGAFNQEFESKKDFIDKVWSKIKLHNNNKTLIDYIVNNKIYDGDKNDLKNKGLTKKDFFDNNEVRKKIEEENYLSKDEIEKLELNQDSENTFSSDKDLSKNSKRKLNNLKSKAVKNTDTEIINEELNRSLLSITNKIFIEKECFNYTGEEDYRKEVIKRTLPYGYILSDTLIFSLGKNTLDNFIDILNNYFRYFKNINRSFHKSWDKIKNASKEQLFFEQIIHYFTTYGYKEIFNKEPEKDFIYIPNENLEVPELNEDINILKIEGIFNYQELYEEIKNIMFKFGAGLKEETSEEINTILHHIVQRDRNIINVDDISRIENNELKVKIYKLFNLTPENAIEFLRFVVYDITGHSMLINSKEFKETLKESLEDNNKKEKVIQHFYNYFNNRENGIENLSSVFFRFNYLFLTLKIGIKRKYFGNIINKIRKKANKNKIRLQEDYISFLTKKVKNGSFNYNEFINEYEKCNNIFKKTRLLNTLNFLINKENDDMLYKVRNGKFFIKEKETISKDKIQTLKQVRDVIRNDIKSIIYNKFKNNVFYIPSYIEFTLPTSEKQFVGAIPQGSKLSLSSNDKDFVVGIHWTNYESGQIDLDLSLLDDFGNKIGWDGLYRNNDILFSGDVTSAPEPYGASELMKVGNQRDKNLYFLLVNFYNYNKEIAKKIKFNIMYGEFDKKKLPEDSEGEEAKKYLLEPDLTNATTSSGLDGAKEKIVGFLRRSEEGIDFYFTDITSSIVKKSSMMSNDKNKALSFYEEYTKNIESLNDLIKESGIKILQNKTDYKEYLQENKEEEKNIIDLSLRNLSKKSFIDLFL